MWLAGEESGDCCVFKGGPYTESRYFGEGVGIAVRKEDADLRRAMDWALARLAARGVYAEIYAKYFPVRVLLNGRGSRARPANRPKPAPFSGARVCFQGLARQISAASARGKWLAGERAAD